MSHDGEKIKSDGYCDPLNAEPVLFRPAITTFNYPSYCSDYCVTVNSFHPIVASKAVAENPALLLCNKFFVHKLIFFFFLFPLRETLKSENTKMKNNNREHFSNILLLYMSNQIQT